MQPTHRKQLFLHYKGLKSVLGARHLKLKRNACKVTGISFWQNKRNGILDTGHHLTYAMPHCRVFWYHPQLSDRTMLECYASDLIAKCTCKRYLCGLCDLFWKWIFEFCLLLPTKRINIYISNTINVNSLELNIIQGSLQY